MLLFRVKKDVVDGCAILAKIIRFSNFSRRHFFTLMIFKFSKSEFYKIKLIQKEADFTKENDADVAFMELKM